LHRPVDLDLNVGPSAIPCEIPSHSQKWIDLCQTKNKMINGPLYSMIIEYISSVKMLCFVIICIQ